MEITLNIEIDEVGTIEQAVTAINLAEGFLKSNYKVKNVLGIVHIGSDDSISLTISCDIKNLQDSVEKVKNTVRTIVKESVK